MSSNAVDPLQLLKALSPLLGHEGAIKSPQEVVRLVSLMRDAKKLVSRCTYCNILKVTTDKPTLDKFVEVGGWNVLNTWLIDAKEGENASLLAEIMKIFKQLPMTIDTLKQNNTAKVIRQISKGEYTEKIKSLAGDLVSVWMSLVKTSSSGTEKPEKKKKKKKESGHSHSHGHGHSSSSSVKVSESGNVNGPKTEKVEKKRTAKVVGPAHTKFRSTGLETETKLPPIKLKKKIISDNVDRPPNIKIPKRTNSEPAKSIQPPEKKLKPSMPTTAVTSPSPTSTTPVNTHGKIKLIPAKPKPVHVINESSGFMDALNAPAAPIRKKVKTKAGGKPGTPTSPTAPKIPGYPSSNGGGRGNDDNTEHRPGTPTPEDEVKDEMPKIRFYTAGQSEEESTKDSNSKKEEGESSEGTGILTMQSKKKKAVSWAESDKLVQVCYFEMDETERVNVNNVKDFRDAAHMDMLREKEAMESAKRGMKITDDNHKVEAKNKEYMLWRKVYIDLPPSPMEPGLNSTEKDTQREREMSVLQEIFFDKASLPDSPHEPDPEAVEPEEPKIIPLEDESAMDAIPADGYAETIMASEQQQQQQQQQHYSHDQQQQAQMQHMQSQQQDMASGGSNLPPALASLMQQAKGPVVSTPPTSQEPPSPNTAVKNVQNLLSSIMGSSSNTQSITPQQMQEEKDMTNKLKEILEPFKNQLPAQGPPMEQEPQGNMQGPPPQGNMQPGPPGPMPPGPHGPPGGLPPMGMPPGGPMHMHGPSPPHPHGQALLPLPGGPGGPRPPMGPGFDQGPYHQGPPPGPMRGSPRGHMRGRGGRGRGDDGFMGRGGFRGRGGPRGRSRGRGRDMSERPVCYHFMGPRGCRFGDQCQFIHPGVNGPPLPPPPPHPPQ
ncbi:serine/threonine-protein phosphatase 1 regulatory subunit 10-like [Ptychodera flava]|uniref:serine/threonine-protein phosphatase 1 regulatory subunit 10-like n=1 Tax=Ptychodera flava TaxID=63121 RepID=UPI003969CC33